MVNQSIFVRKEACGNTIASTKANGWIGAADRECSVDQRIGLVSTNDIANSKDFKATGLLAIKTAVRSGPQNSHNKRSQVSSIASWVSGSTATTGGSDVSGEEVDLSQLKSLVHWGSVNHWAG